MDHCARAGCVFTCRAAWMVLSRAESVLCLLLRLKAVGGKRRGEVPLEWHQLKPQTGLVKSRGGIVRDGSEKQGEEEGRKTGFEGQRFCVTE